MQHFEDIGNLSIEPYVLKTVMLPYCYEYEQI